MLTIRTNFTTLMSVGESLGKICRPVWEFTGEISGVTIQWAERQRVALWVCIRCGHSGTRERAQREATRQRSMCAWNVTNDLILQTLYSQHICSHLHPPTLRPSTCAELKNWTTSAGVMSCHWNMKQRRTSCSWNWQISSLTPSKRSSTPWNRISFTLYWIESSFQTFGGWNRRCC